MDYSNVTTAITALFFDGKVLILQRGETAPWMPGKWSLVGGVVDEGETIIDALKREVFEETGMVAMDYRLRSSIKNEEIGKLMIYVADVKDDDVTLDSENVAYSFISFEELDRYEFVPYVKEFLLKILKH